MLAVAGSNPISTLSIGNKSAYLELDGSMSGEHGQFAQKMDKIIGGILLICKELEK